MRDLSGQNHEFVVAALRELHSAVTDLHNHVRVTTTEGMWPDTERLTFAPIDVALGKANEAIQALHCDGKPRSGNIDRP